MAWCVIVTKVCGIRREARQEGRDRDQEWHVIETVSVG
jgi:hypothetical protein